MLGEDLRGFTASIMSPSLTLEPVSLRLQLGGRLRNVSRLKHWYMAIAEAIQNAMDAIADSGRSGWIEVRIERVSDLVVDGDAPVENVVIIDNGVGFTSENFDSFCTPDSLRKQQRGGKGLGRLMCLQAFQRIEIDSKYANGVGNRHRYFILQSDAPELRATDLETTDQTTGTQVRLCDLRSEYSATASASFDKIADWLIEHFLPSLVEKPGWLEKIVVSDGKRKADLTKIVESGATWSQDFRVKGYDFRVACYSVSSGSKVDMVRLVAGGRIVNANTQPLEFFLPHLANVSDTDPHLILVSSPFFDEHVNDARNGVSFADESETALLGVTAPEFRLACAEALKQQLGDRLSTSVDAFKRRVENVVVQEARYYRPLLLGFFVSREFSSLSTSARDEEILAALDAYKRRDAIKLKQESKRLAKLNADDANYLESARKLADQIEVQKKVALAEYVTLRKIVLDRLEQLISNGPEGKPHREAAIHNLVFPQRVDTETAPGVDHQLWILDERLESHIYLSSDKPMDGARGDRPDLLIALDHPGAFAAEPFSHAKGYERMVLVEFKQALRDMAKVATDDLPHQQMMRYARQINEGTARHLKSGRPIKLSQDARFYMYAVCELSEDLLIRLEELGFTRASSGDGAFWVTNKGRYYVEYISLQKLLEDAIARNIAFFRRLGIEA